MNVIREMARITRGMGRLGLVTASVIALTTTAWSQRRQGLTEWANVLGVEYRIDLVAGGEDGHDLELVRYFKPEARSGGEFGEGWHLFIPYRIHPHGHRTRTFLNAIIPQRMVLENLLTGQEEVLGYDVDRLGLAGYLPDAADSSPIIGLFIMADASHRLIDSLDREFRFDPAGNLTDLILAEDYHLIVDYADSYFIAFDEPPYHMQPYGDQQIEVLGASLPACVTVADVKRGHSEKFVYAKEARIVCYVPEKGRQSRYESLKIMSSGSCRLIDKMGSEYLLDAAGACQGVFLSEEFWIVESISLGRQKIDFGYSLDRQGQPRIALAQVTSFESGQERDRTMVYRYDANGRLAGVEPKRNDTSSVAGGMATTI